MHRSERRSATGQGQGSEPPNRRRRGRAARVGGRGASFPQVAVSLLALVAGAGASAQDAEALAAAEGVVARLHAALVHLAAGPDDVRERAEEIAPVVRQTHDLPFIAALSIRRQWRELPPAVRERFVGAFERLSVMTYATRFAAVGDETFRIIGSEATDAGRIEVNAAIRRPDADDVALDYVLQRDGDTWRIVNILADGVSDLALKRAQYQRIFADGGSIDDVIGAIEAEIARL